MMVQRIAETMYKMLCGADSRVHQQACPFNVLPNPVSLPISSESKLQPLGRESFEIIPAH